ncbi:hypothetical protein Ssi03_62160 [Sphaerisporangium siamense]|uniref:Transcriptional regulator WhiB n=1 Tax=Sphaerisporangium siamense TaxID=795645 RepID=A0A7W7D946_9ACTN|nr:WhiB family transcriptional regulator [Sphaerisporangium siamense]MBB4702527.1 WhiB family redox-sensing transcriptional regulator [Sphaerisporangium siamense]GII88226.1 hypothetical protein Ssi03_62160 [Sphaerisporangium siamense]
MSRRTAWGLDTPHGPHWTNRAACKGQDPELFFEPAARSKEDPDVKRAKAICAGCPVRRECLIDAVERKEQYGIWGGLTEREMRAILRGRKRPGPLSPDDEALCMELDTRRRRRGLTWRQAIEEVGIRWEAFQALRNGRATDLTRERVTTWLSMTEGAA